MYAFLNSQAEKLLNFNQLDISSVPPPLNDMKKLQISAESAQLKEKARESLKEISAAVLRIRCCIAEFKKCIERLVIITKNDDFFSVSLEKHREFTKELDYYEVSIIKKLY